MCLQFYILGLGGKLKYCNQEVLKLPFATCSLASREINCVSSTQNTSARFRSLVFAIAGRGCAGMRARSLTRAAGAHRVLIPGLALQLLSHCHYKIRNNEFVHQCKWDYLPTSTLRH
jgi:hypothetical protein